MQPLWFVAGAVNGLVAVAAGAFGAHALRELPERYTSAFKTGAQYEMYHALALLFIAVLPRTPLATTAGACLLAGTLLFSGTLYLLALTRQDWFGAITPLGGVLLLAGWAALVTCGLRLAR
jgi:uncharacterized membrane protein YgdD (TMEM256/DUF423 family)